MTPLPPEWFQRDARTVALDLLGCHLHRQRMPDEAGPGGAGAPRGGAAGDGAEGDQVVRIVETEAYVGSHDLACHARSGRTPRTDVMFGSGGMAYVYLVYGLHELLNVVTGPEGSGEAVLVRAAEPVRGVEARLDGPGRLTRSLGIDRALNRHDLRRPPLWIEPGTPPPRVAEGPRIGVDYAGDWAAAPLRFWDADSRHVSGPKRR